MNVSKQQFHQWLNRWLKNKEEEQLLIPIIEQIREDHPSMSAREMYKKVQPEQMGRDKFESFCFDHGYRVLRPRNYRKTTDSRGVRRFPNLVKDIELTGVNQVLVSDITYYEIQDRFYYLTFIMDLYNREIVGHSVSKTLTTRDTTLTALKRAVNKLGKVNLEGTIIHSDGGSQYYKTFQAYTSELDMKNSMGKNVYDNPHAERVNGTIKNGYVKYWEPKTYQELVASVDRAVNNYNKSKPHQGNKGLAPIELRNRLNRKAVENENNSVSYRPFSTAHQNYKKVV